MSTKINPTTKSVEEDRKVKTVRPIHQTRHPIYSRPDAVVRKNNCTATVRSNH